MDDRARFIVRTYNHLFGAILLFTAIEFALFQLGLALPVAQALLAGGLLVMMGGFILVSWIASRAAHSSQSKLAQYAALAAFVVAEAIISLPILRRLFFLIGCARAGCSCQSQANYTCG